MTIGRSPTSTKSMIVTPPRRRKEWHHDTLVSLRSLALSMSTLNHDDDDGTTTKFRLAPRYHHTDGQYYHYCQKLPHCINDDSIQSPAVHRRYRRRGSRTPSMLAHVALLETLTAATADSEPSEERNTNDSHHHHHNNVVTLV